MTTLLEIKPYIHDFIQENLDESFGNKIYWIGERVNEPDYPYCLLNVIAENKDKRTSTHNGDLVEFIESGQSNVQELREGITTRYKTAVITIGIYNAFVSNTYEDMDMDEAKEFAYEQIDRLEGLFEKKSTHQKFYPHFSIQGTSPIRPLHEPVTGGYMYRYEFDLTVGYNEPVTDELEIGKVVDAEIENGSSEIDFIVEINSSTNEINVKI